MKVTEITGFRATSIAAVLAISSGLIGCSNTAELDSLRSQIMQTKSDVSAALDDADEAKALATQANKAASEAMNTANSAKAAADAANATSLATESKIDRMFKKAMYK